MNNNNEGGVRKGYNNRRFATNNPRKSNNNSEYRAKKAEIIAKQTTNLDMIDKVSGFLDGLVQTMEPDSKIAMKQIIDFLNESGYDKDATKTISQYNYLLMDLANAQACTYITGNRLNIRILYIQERLKSSYKKELSQTIDKIFGKHENLFKWSEDASEDIVYTPATDEVTSNDLVKEDSSESTNN